jgi:hypothetical protein
MEEPPGGPPDFASPVILTITPDSGAVLDGFGDEVEFQFDEVISESSGGGLEQLFRISPRHEETKVSWKRKRLTVRPGDGWRDSVAYQVTLLPGIADLRNNRLDSGRTVTFSTGGPIPDTRITGTVIDWEAGRAGERALIEVIRLSDSLTYIGQSDSVGDFELQAIPPGRYLVQSVIDQNNNDRRESREAFDSATIDLDSLFTRTFWTFQHDTVGPRITQLTRRDSLAIGLEFSQSLFPDLPGPEAISVRVLPDSTPVEIAALLAPSVFDSLRAAAADSARAAADSARQDTSVVDSAAVQDTTIVAARDTAAVTPADTLAVAPSDTAAAAADTATAAEPDTSRVAQLLRERPPLTRSVVITLVDTLIPDGRYLVEATVRNVLGVAEQSLQVLVTPPAPELPENPPPAPPDTSGRDPR